MNKINNLRHIHRFFAPLMVIPLLLTSITGCIYQFMDILGRGESLDWLLDIHKGNFGIIDLESIYPFFNALGILILSITGVLLWFKIKFRTGRNHSN